MPTALPAPIRPDEPFLDYILRPELGPPPNPAQLALAALVAGDIETANAVVAEYLPGSPCLGGVLTRPPRTALGTVLAVCGRRAGKTSTVGARYVMWRCHTADLSKLAKGERAYFALIAPTLPQARQTLDFLEGMGASRPNRDTCEVNGVVVQGFAAGKGGGPVRGKSLVGAILDEAAFFQGDGHVLNAGDIYRAVRPGIATIPGGRCLLLTSPWGKSGLVWDMFRKNFGCPTTALVMQAPTRLMRPDDADLLEEIDRAYLEDPEAAAREFGAEFDSADQNSYFDGQVVDLAEKRPLPTGPVARVMMGLDLAQARDSAACVMLAEYDSGQVAVVDVQVWQPRPGAPLHLTEIIPRVCDTAQAVGVDVIFADQWAIHVANELCIHGVRIEPIPGGAGGKAECYGRFREALPRMVLPGDLCGDTLTPQLRRVTQALLPGGGLKISSPRVGGCHGDTASAAAAAAYQLFESRALGRYYRGLQRLARQDP